MPAEHSVAYRTCFDLLEAAASGRVSEQEGRARETRACGETLVLPASKAARTFFFTRRAALEASRHGSPRPSRWWVSVQGGGDLAGALSRRNAHDVEVVAGEVGPCGAGEQSLSLATPAGANPTVDAVVITAPLRQSLTWSADVVAYSPLFRQGFDVVEVAHRDAPGRAASVCDAFERLGFSAIVSSPGSWLLLDDLVDAYFAPIRAFARCPDTFARADVTLGELGFVRRPGELAQLLGASDLAELAEVARDDPDCAREPALANAVLLCLAARVARWRVMGRIRHPAQADLLAREVLDFPLALGSLCRWATVERVEGLLETVDAFQACMPEDDLTAAREYVDDGRSFYA